MILVAFFVWLTLEQWILALSAVVHRDDSELRSLVRRSSVIVGNILPLSIDLERACIFFWLAWRNQTTDTLFLLKNRAEAVTIRVFVV